MAKIPCIDFSKWIADETGYRTKTTFWHDFYIAEVFGESAIKDTYKRATKEWKSNTEYITELVLVLNHKIWFFHEMHQRTNDPLFDKYARLYNDLWMELDGWCCDNLKGEDASYYFQTLD